MAIYVETLTHAIDRIGGTFLIARVAPEIACWVDCHLDLGAIGHIAAHIVIERIVIMARRTGSKAIGWQDVFRQMLDNGVAAATTGVIFRFALLVIPDANNITRR